MKHILPHMEHADDNIVPSSVIVSATANGLDIKGYEPSSEESYNEATIELVINDENSDSPPGLNING